MSYADDNKTSMTSCSKRGIVCPMQKDFNKLIHWSEQFQYLPWRQNRSLYRTLVSEIMLQQTTVATVLNKFEGFINQYPNISKLAEATEDDMLIAWKGLGYYRRAKNLLAAAKYIKANYNAKIPTDYDRLTPIPGIGDYTANAILAIGDQQKALAIDTNIERVISRYYGLDLKKGPKLKKEISQLFNNKIINLDVSFRALNEGIMDLGREYCKSTRVCCDSCPLQFGCKKKKDLLINPIIKKPKNITYDLALLRVLIIEGNSLICYKKTEGEWLAGQWECPTFIVNNILDIKQYPCIKFCYKDLTSFKTNITKYKISNYILKINLKEFYRLFSWDRQLQKISISQIGNLSTATQKALDYLNNKK